MVASEIEWQQKEWPLWNALFRLLRKKTALSPSNCGWRLKMFFFHHNRRSTSELLRDGVPWLFSKSNMHQKKVIQTVRWSVTGFISCNIWMKVETVKKWKNRWNALKTLTTKLSQEKSTEMFEFCLAKCPTARC